MNYSRYIVHPLILDLCEKRKRKKRMKKKEMKREENKPMEKSKN